MPTDVQSTGGYNLPKSKPKKTTKKPAAKPKGNAAVFGPVAPVGFHKAQKAAHGKVRKAEQAAVRKGAGRTIATPQFPTLKKYTPAQRETIKKAWRAKAVEIHKTLPRADAVAALDAYDLLSRTADRETRRQLHKLQGLNSTDERNRTIALGRATAKTYGVGHLGPKNSLKLGQSVLDSKADESAGINARGPAERAPKPKPKAKSGGLLKKVQVAGINLNPLHAIKAGVGDVLRVAETPAMFVSGAAHAVDHDENVLRGALANAKSHRYGFGEIFRERGYGPTAAAILGSGAAVVTDPLNLVGAGAAPVAEQLARRSTEAATIAKDLRDAGKAAKAVKYEALADALARKAADAPTNRGIQLRLGGRRTNVVTSGKTTAKLSRALGGSDLAARIHDTPLSQGVMRRLNADTRPAGVSREEWQAWLDHARLGRAAAHNGKYQAARLGRATNATLHGEAHGPVLDALEGRGRDYVLSGAQHRVTASTRELLDRIGEVEVTRGLLKAARPDYLPHVLSKDARKALDRVGRAGAKRNPFDVARTSDLTVSEANALSRAAVGADKFETNLGAIVNERAAKHYALTAHRDLGDAVVRDLGRSYEDAGSLRPGDAVYVWGKKTGLRKLPGDRTPADPKYVHEVDAARRGLREGERLVVLNRSIGDRAVAGVMPGGRIAGRDVLPHEGHGGQYFDRANGKLKSALTVFNAPAYQLRNFAGDAWNGRLAGTTSRDLATGVRLAKLRTARTAAERKALDAITPDHMVSIGHGRQMSAHDLIDLAERHGVVASGFAGADLTKGGSELGGRFADPRAVAAGLRPVEAIRTGTQFGEDANRLATFVGALRRGESPNQAARTALRHHFDYGNLSDFEQNVLKRFAPFWTFTARNTPLQAGAVLRRPGQFANYGLVQDEWRRQAGLPADWQERLPGYMRRQLALPVNVHGRRLLLSPQFPLADLNRVQAVVSGDLPETFKSVAQMIHPAAKWPIELGANYSLFFRDPVYADKDHPDAQHLVSAPWWVKRDYQLNKMLAGGSADAAEKGLITSKADYFLRLLPQLNTLNSVGGSGTSSRAQTALDAVASQLSGVKVNEFRPDKYALNAVYDRIHELELKARDAQRLGHAEKAKKLRHREYELRQSLPGAQKHRGTKAPGAVFKPGAGSFKPGGF